MRATAGALPRWTAAALLTAAAALPLRAAQPPAADLLRKAAAHVEQFAFGMSHVVAMETYEQAQQTDCTRSSTLSARTTRADLLVLHVGKVGWVPFRDVYEVDGRTVRDRGERIKSLLTHFDPDSVEQAVALNDENARFNLNTTFVDRTINTPMTALMFLQADHQARSAFKVDGVARIGAVACDIVSFVEQQTPSLIESPYGIAVRGRFWIEPQTGAVLRSELRADASLNGAGTQVVRARVTVDYKQDARLGLWVPATMDETYDIGTEGQFLRSQVLTGKAEYSDFRQFGVTTSTSLPETPGPATK